MFKLDTGAEATLYQKGPAQLNFRETNAQQTIQGTWPRTTTTECIYVLGQFEGSLHYLLGLSAIWFQHFHAPTIILLNGWLAIRLQVLIITIFACLYIRMYTNSSLYGYMKAPSCVCMKNTG